MTTATSAFHVTSPPTIAAGGDLRKTATSNTNEDPSPTGVLVSLGSSDQPPPTENPIQLMEDETEDEEVKMNCIGGVRGTHESDMNTTDDDMSDDDDGDDGDEENDPDDTQGVVQFISNRVPRKSAFPLLRPKATTPPTPTRLSPHEEGDEERSTTSSSDGDDESSCSSVGARGIPFAIGTPASMEADDDDDEAADDSEDENGENDSDESSTSSSSESEDENEAEQPESPVKSESVSEVVEAVDNYSSEEQVDELSTETDGALDGSNDELSDLLISMGEDPIAPVPDELDTSERFIGVMEDGEDIVVIPKTKRVLSFNTLAALNIEARGRGHSPKRLCKDYKVTESSEPPFLLGSFTLGQPAASHLRRRESSPVISSSDEEGDEYDRQLGEELAGNPEEPEERDETPVPLLTPPGSPAVCEWPSNLTVDSAMAAASELRPLSPASLEDLERKDQELEEQEEARPQSPAGVCPSTLTPMLQGISVGRD